MAKETPPGSVIVVHLWNHSNLYSPIILDIKPLNVLIQ